MSADGAPRHAPWWPPASRYERRGARGAGRAARAACCRASATSAGPAPRRSTWPGWPRAASTATSSAASSPGTGRRARCSSTEAGGARGRAGGRAARAGRGEPAAAAAAARAGRAALGAILKARAFVPFGSPISGARRTSPRPILRAARGGRPARAAGARAPQPRVPRALGESPDTLVLPGAWSGRSAAAQHRPLGGGHPRLESAARARLRHPQPHAHVRQVPRRLPRHFPPASREALIPACVVRAHSRPGTQHAPSRQRLDVYVAWPGSDTRLGGQADPDQAPQLWVHDQDERSRSTGALAWRFAPTDPRRMVQHRWLTVGLTRGSGRHRESRCWRARRQPVPGRGER